MFIGNIIYGEDGHMLSMILTGGIKHGIYKIGSKAMG